jgi:hypothetical protein
MDIQSLLVSQARGTLDITEYPISMLKTVKKKLDGQMNLIGLCQNKKAIPQAEAMKRLLEKIQTELKGRNDAANL